MKLVLSTGIAALTLLGAAPAHAATLIGVFSGNDCANLSVCFATQSGLNVPGGALPSFAVAKYNGSEADQGSGLAPFELDETSANFPSIVGNEFALGFDDNTNVASFAYTPGAGDPNIHYFSIKQGAQYALFYDAAPITSGSIDLDGISFSAGRDSFSHMTFFNSGTPAVPEPSTWAMMLFGFGAIGFAMRRRKQVVRVRLNYA